MCPVFKFTEKFTIFFPTFSEFLKNYSFSGIRFTEYIYFITILLLVFFALFRSPSSCFFHSTSVNFATRLTSRTTNQYQKICPGVLTNVNPFATQSSATTLSTAPTTAATVIPIPTIGVDGLQYLIFVYCSD